MQEGMVPIICILIIDVAICIWLAKFQWEFNKFREESRVGWAKIYALVEDGDYQSLLDTRKSMLEAYEELRKELDAIVARAEVVHQV